MAVRLHSWCATALAVLLVTACATFGSVRFESKGVLELPTGAAQTPAPSQ